MSWGENITVNGQDVDMEEDNSAIDRSDDNGLEDSGSAWGSGITVEGQSSGGQSFGQTATIDITFKTSIVRTIGGREYESVDNGRQPSITEFGSTYLTNDYGSSCWLSLGLNIHNPNMNLLAYNVQLEIVVKDTYGSTVDVLSDYISFIDAGATFHYGKEFYIDSPNVGQISGSAYASDFYRVDRKMGSTCKFEDISRRRNTFGDVDLFGELRNSGSQGIDWCTGYIQFLDGSGRIKGGACGSVNSVPAYQSRPLKINCSVGLDTNSYVTDTDFSL